MVRSFLEELLPCYPEESRKILRGIVREISTSEPTEWDVVIGNPKAAQKDGRETFAGCTIHYGAPKSVPVRPGVLRTQVASLYIAFYAMIRSKYIWEADWALLEKYRFKVAQVIENRKSLNGGILPKQYDEVLPGNRDDSVFDRLGLLIQAYHDGKFLEMPPEIHGPIGDISKVKDDPSEAENASQGDEKVSWQAVRRRSEGGYMARVHKAAGHERPTLQLYLFHPDGTDDGAYPMVGVSFYWPGHVPDGFFTVCVDESPDSVRLVTPRVFCQNVEDILKERDFPVQRKELLRLVIERLGLRCNENFFEAHIATPLDGFQYHKMENRSAYCINGWAKDEEQRLASEWLQAVIHILQRDKTPYTAEKIIEQVKDEEPKFRDFFNPTKENCAKLDKLMTDELMRANGIVRSEPTTYRYRG
ncbi:MAG: hypothetical protein IJR99_12770 [Kiritimatiellae bacterium]|nr:hypothetical protein [Kiritimatiellia bacterium]